MKGHINMINLLITDDNLNFVKTLSNYLCSSSSQIRVANISCNGLETFEYLKDNCIDIIILDLDMPIMNGLDFLNLIEKQKNSLQIIPKIIILSSKISSFSNIHKFNMVHSVINKTNCFNKIYETILSIYNECTDTNVIRKIITNELLTLHFNLKHIGTNYLIEAILWIYFHPNDFYNLEKNVYSKIAKKIHKNPLSIKSNIQKAINYIYVENDFSLLKNYFSLYIDIKPTPKDIISTIINKIT